MVVGDFNVILNRTEVHLLPVATVPPTRVFTETTEESVSETVDTSTETWLEVFRQMRRIELRAWL